MIGWQLELLESLYGELVDFGARWAAVAEEFKLRNYELPPEVWSSNAKRLRQWIKANLWVHTAWLKLGDGELRERLASQLWLEEDRRASQVVAERAERLALGEFAPLARGIVEQLGWQRLCAVPLAAGCAIPLAAGCAGALEAGCAGSLAAGCAGLPPAPKPARGAYDAADIVRALCRIDDHDTSKAGGRLLVWGAMADDPRAFRRPRGWARHFAAWARSLVIPLDAGDGYRLIAQPFVDWAPAAVAEWVRNERAEVARPSDAAWPDAMKRGKGEEGKRGGSLARRGETSGRVTIHNGVTIDPRTFSVECRGKRCSFPNGREYALLTRLCRNPGIYVSVGTLIEEVWNDYLIEKGTVQRTASTLRAKLRKAGIVEIEIDGQKRDHYAVVPGGRAEGRGGRGEEGREGVKRQKALGDRG